MTIEGRKSSALKSVKTRKYLNKDFSSLRDDLLEYARIHFPDRISDFSETSLGGLLLEMPAYVGDVQSFYLDHQFHELNPETAVESRNIQSHIKNAGVKIVGASPAVVDVKFSIVVGVDNTVSPPIPDTRYLPIIYAGTVVQSQNNIQFELIEDVDFTKTDRAGNLLANIKVEEKDDNNAVISYRLELTKTCISGFRASESFSVGNFEAFKKYTLGQANVTEVISVTDALGNTYYEVEFLTQDTVWKAIPNFDEDNNLVQDNLEMLPCPYRFISEMSLDTRLTTLTFGGGSADSLDDDVVPDPSEFALPLYGKRTFSRVTLNPSTLLRSSTLGVIGENTTITIEYRYGGGLSHNVESESIRSISNLLIGFPNGATPVIASQVRQSISVINEKKASGGDDAPNLDELKLRIPGAKNSQNRIVTKEDLLSRVYTMPSNFGRVFRASIRSNPNNPLSSILYVISRDSTGRLQVCSDSLKKNLAKYLNSYRIISDAIDILDGQIINVVVEFTVIADPRVNRSLLLNNIISRLKQYFNVKYFDMDQPIVIEEIRNIIFNNEGVLAIQSLNIRNVTGILGNRVYSDIQFDPSSNTNKGMIIPPPGGMFELKFADNDIIGSVV